MTLNMLYITHIFINFYLIQFLNRGENRFSMKDGIVFLLFKTDN